MACRPFPVTPSWAKFGLHLGWGASLEAVKNANVYLLSQGKYFGSIKAVTGAEGIISYIEATSPQTVTVFRSIAFGDCPNFQLPATTAAEIWLSGLVPIWKTVPADYYEVINECEGAGSTWLRDFSLKALDLAENKYHIQILVLSHGVGNPSLAGWHEYVPIYEYILAHPQHGIAIHTYGLDKPLMPCSVWTTCRFVLNMGEILPEVPQAAQVPIFITEAGQYGGFGSDPPMSCDQQAAVVKEYLDKLNEYEYIQFMHLWTLTNQAQWWDVTNCLDEIVRVL